MKFIVDELPKCPNECDLSCPHVIFGNVYGCRMTNDSKFICGIGTEGFECPYLKKFEADAKEEVQGYSNTFRNIPVVLRK